MTVDFVQNCLIPWAIGKVLRPGLAPTVGDATSKGGESPAAMVEAVRWDVAFEAGFFQTVPCAPLDFEPVWIVRVACEHCNYTPVNVDDRYHNPALPHYTAIKK